MITRIRELLEAHQLSPTQFADLIGVGRPVISHILSERNKPSLEVVQKIISAFPDIALPWLLAGTGPMLATSAAVPSSTSAPSDSTAEAAFAPTPAPVVAAPTAVATPPAPPIAQPAAFARPSLAPPPSSYPQPPRFRPGAATATTNSRPTDEPARAATPPPAAVPPTLPVAAIDATAATSPGVPPVAAAPAPAVAAQAPPLAAPGAPPASAAAEPLGSPAVLTAESAPLPASPSAEVPTIAHPAAALSFLGEPGKAIRRIVIFYRDGSFSDYQPEGN